MCVCVCVYMFYTLSCFHLFISFIPPFFLLQPQHPRQPTVPPPWPLPWPTSLGHQLNTTFSSPSPPNTNSIRFHYHLLSSSPLKSIFTSSSSPPPPPCTSSTPPNLLLQRALHSSHSMASEMSFRQPPKSFFSTRLAPRLTPSSSSSLGRGR